MRQVCTVAMGVLLTASWCGVANAAPPAEPLPDPLSAVTTTVAPGDPGLPLPVVEVPPPIVNPNVVSTPLVIVPSGCPAELSPAVVFVGTLAAADAATARFAVQQIRAGSLDGYAVDTIVDVRFEDDIRFLRAGQQYLVGAVPDPITQVLHSKVRLQAPLFGGDAVIGVDDSDVSCPRVEDGVKTLLVNGTEVDTGVLAPLKTAKKSMARAIVEPLAVAFAVLVILASMKLLLFSMVRAAREREPEEDLPPVQIEAQRIRYHDGNELSPMDEESDTSERV